MNFFISHMQNLSIISDSDMELISFLNNRASLSNCIHVRSFYYVFMTSYELTVYLHKLKIILCHKLDWKHFNPHFF